MDLKRIIYSSQPFGFDESALAGILMDARRCNDRDDISGALICRRDIYLQLIEGPEAALDATFERIRRDDRHLDIRALMSGPVTERLFGAWRMLHDPAETWLWTEAEIDDGILERIAPELVLAKFTSLSVRAAAASSGQ